MTSEDSEPFISGLSVKEFAILNEASHGWGSHVIDFFALGTAIIRAQRGSAIEPPVAVLDLND